MANLTEIALAFLLLGAFVVALLVGFLLFRRSLRERRAVLSGEIAANGERAKERAENQLKFGEAELAVLRREGFDATRPTGVLADARAAYARRDYYQSMQLSQNAHDLLVALRRGGGSANPPMATLGVEAGSERSDDPLAGPDDATEPPRPTFAKNRMESQFQIARLTEDLGAAVRADPNAPGLAVANRLAAEARDLASKEQYTEALGVALRARRALGGRIESVPAVGGSGSTPLPETAAVERIAGPKGPVDGASGASRGECPSCHKPLRSGDSFCRSCGRSVSAPSCPRCRAPMDAEDRFCPRCGAPTS